LSTIPQAIRFITSLDSESAYGTAIVDGSLTEMYNLVDPAFGEVNFDYEDDSDFLKGHEFMENVSARVQLFKNSSFAMSNVPANSEIAGWLFGAALGDVTTTGAGPYVHECIIQDAGTGLQLPSRTIAICYEGSTSNNRKYKGGVINDMTYRIDKKGRSTFDFNMTTDGDESSGSGVAIPAAFTSTNFHYGKNAVFEWCDDGGTYADNSAIVRSFEFSMNNNLLLDEAKAKHLGTGLNIDELWFDTREYTFSIVVNADELTTDADGDVIYTDFLNQTLKEFRVTMTSGTTSVVIELPKMVWGVATKGYEGPRRTLTLEPALFYDTAVSSPIVVTVTNGDATIVS
jgi:hypothetical protein